MDITDNGIRLTLTRETSDRYAVSIEAPGLAAATSVWEHRSGDGFSEFAAALNQDWRGWDGLRSWASLEGELRLSASNDEFGVVTVRVELTEQTRPGEWRAAATMSLGAGAELSRFADKIRRFFA